MPSHSSSRSNRGGDGIAGAAACGPLGQQPPEGGPARTAGRPAARLALAALLAALMLRPDPRLRRCGMAGLARAWRAGRERVDPDLELVAMLGWMRRHTEPGAAFTSNMRAAASIKLGARRAITLHPHFESAPLRRRVRLGYALYSRLPPPQVHDELRAVLRVGAPAVLGAQVSFAEDWNWAAGSLPGLSWSTFLAPPGADAHVLVLPSGPADELETAGLMFIHAIHSAQNRIWIASPYFVPDEAIMLALHLARLRGVDVRILIPDRPDHLLVYLAAFSYFEEADRSGIKLFRYTDGFLHSKTMLIDDTVAAIGTANFDNRSFRLNFEITVLAADGDFVSEVETMFLDDLARSRPIDGSEYRDRPWWFRLGVRLSRLTAPVL